MFQNRFYVVDIELHKPENRIVCLSLVQHIINNSVVVISHTFAAVVFRNAQ